MTPNKTRKKCNLCSTVYKFSTSQTNMKKHMKSVHPNIFNEMAQGSSIYDTMLGMRKPLPHENLMINKLILIFLIKTNISFSTIDNSAFKRIFNYANKNIKLWCRQTIKKNLDNVYNLAKNNLIEKLNNHTNLFSITTDIWTANNIMSFCALTFHYINKNWVNINLVLHMIAFPHPHTGDEICKIVLFLLEEFKLKDRILSITHVNGSNEVKAVQLLQKYYQSHYSKILYGYRCLAHIINLIVKVGLNCFEEKLKNIEQIVAKLHSSSKFMQSYKAVSGATKILLAVKTRWNSKYLMISSINKNMNAIQDLVKQGIIGTDITPTPDDCAFFIKKSASNGTNDNS
ncbi:uncharacterized protein LOC135931889 isoform X1 [Gordionus sp. m RMFG-2023]|uniref:uncharacterized protein LOC135931889 isoform X1 n=1 Tax=Gordionus sp. m RMFG-2023 TaxID=3053472 RepID=UPI0031FC7254